jgi:drug/metabolite transporter (DMT)-like permease
MHKKFQAVFILTIGVFSISLASIFIKMCTAPAVIIAAYRLGIASIFYLGIGQFRKKRSSHLSGSDLGLVVVSGWFLALHFLTWIKSLDYTSVASSVVLVQTSPVFVAIGGAVLLKERVSLLKCIGIGVAVAGSIVVGAIDRSFSSSAPLGNTLAVFGAVSAAGYLLIGRTLRRRVEIIHYVTVLYGSAAIFTLIYVFFSRLSLLSYPQHTFILLLAIAMIPQVIGHTTLNWALKYFSATAVAVIALGEPLCATILAWSFLHEKLTLLKACSAALILSGVILVLIAEAKETSLHRPE